MNEDQSIRVTARPERPDATTGIVTPRPRVSWVIETRIPGWRQARAELELDGTTVAVVEGSESAWVEWPFDDLQPLGRHRLRVRVEGVDGSASPWSEPCDLESAFLQPGGWTAEFIGMPAPAAPAAPFLARHEFDVAPDLRRATLVATARGVFQVELNGVEVDDREMKPGWTPYAARILSEFTDVTDLLHGGRNAIGATVAGGWYTEEYGLYGEPARAYGDHPSFAAQLLLEYDDADPVLVSTGRGWRASGAGPLVSSGIYAGETYDARRELPGWSRPGFDDTTWEPAHVDATAGPVPSARTTPAVRVIEERAVGSVITSASGAPLLDFGQNVVGRLRLRIRAEAGTEITLRHAEVLQGGELALGPLRRAEATDRYICRGGGDEVWEPRFTFHGFRYVQITGAPVDPADVVARVMHSDMERTGWFECSDPLVNRLHENVVWGMRGNFLSIPTDCPQRDERLGWTGDVRVFAPTATSLYDAHSFLTSWMTDVVHEQDALGTGGVPWVVPSVLESPRDLVAGWGDVATVVPWVLWERSGDRRVLERHFPSMRAWVDAAAARRRDGLWEGSFQLGDWLDPDAPADRPARGKTDPDLIATAFLYRSARLVADTADALGDHTAHARYAALADEIDAAFTHTYVTAAGRITSDSPAAYAVAIGFGLAASSSVAFGERLAQLVRVNAYRIGTGFVGTDLLPPALTATGHAEVAGRMLMQTENPSWLYPVTMGATTVWERWDALREDGALNAAAMTSFNHYALGAIADWLHTVVAGLSPESPGYRTMRIEPTPLGGLDEARVRRLTPYGEAAVSWRRVGDVVEVEATIPANTSATVVLAGDEIGVVGSGRHRWVVPWPEPATPAVALSGGTPLDAIVADPDAYHRVRDVLRAPSGPVPLTQWRDISWTRGRTLRELLLRLPVEERARLEAVLTGSSAPAAAPLNRG